jgi:hypothetical protein
LTIGDADATVGRTIAPIPIAAVSASSTARLAANELRTMNAKGTSLLSFD